MIRNRRQDTNDRKQKQRLPGWAVFSLCAAAAGIALRIISRISVMIPGVIPGATPGSVPGVTPGSVPGVTLGTAFADRFSDIVNPIAVNTLGRLSSLVPFSIAELLLIALVLYLIYVAILLLGLMAERVTAPYRATHDTASIRHTNAAGSELTRAAQSNSCLNGSELEEPCPGDACQNGSGLEELNSGDICQNGSGCDGPGRDGAGHAVHSQLQRRTLRHLKRLAVIAAAMFLIFEVNEDVYFARTRFAARYGLERTNYTDDELAEVCAMLIEEINRTAPLVQRDEEGIMQIGLNGAARFADLAARMRLSMARLGETCPELAGYCPRPKPVIFSTLLSCCDITGVYSMFTVEANINRDMPPYNLPFTMGHELAHLKGFESEKEANFLGFLAAITSDDADIRYSGAMLGWIYCGNELHRRDLGRWEALHATLDPAAVRDLDDNSRYWEHYKGKASETMHDINDAYLRTEGLAEGYASYDLVVDMIVTYVLTAEASPDAGVGRPARL